MRRLGLFIDSPRPLLSFFPRRSSTLITGNSTFRCDSELFDLPSFVVTVSNQRKPPSKLLATDTYVVKEPGRLSTDCFNGRGLTTSERERTLFPPRFSGGKLILRLGKATFSIQKQKGTEIVREMPQVSWLHST